MEIINIIVSLFIRGFAEFKRNSNGDIPVRAKKKSHTELLPKAEESNHTRCAFILHKSFR